MKPEDVVREYLPQVRIMQLATAQDDHPYLCTVHYYSDPDLNLYWTSKLERNHSGHIKRNSRVAAYVLVHENTPDEDYVIGITFVGRAKLVGAKINPDTAKSYADKLGHGAKFLREVADDTTPHKFYKLTPEKIILFDNKDFPDDPRKEVIL